MKSYTQISNMIACKNDRAFYDKCYVIGHEYGPFAIVYADCEQDAIDSAVDNGKMDMQLVSPEELEEAIKDGLEDEFLTAGNASEYFHQDYLWIVER